MRDRPAAWARWPRGLRCWPLPALAVMTLWCLVTNSGLAQQRVARRDLEPEEAPFERQQWMLRQRAYPLSTIPSGALLRGFEATKAHDESVSRLAQPATWFWKGIGPSPISQQAPGYERNGRIDAVAVHPTNVNRWLIGAAEGGIWETTDAGATWTPRTDDQPSLAMGAIAYAYSNPSIIYAGTGDAENGGSYGGVGVLKSIDGGQNWQLLASATFAGNAFSDVAVDPADANVVVASVTTSRFGRNFEGASTPPAGLFKSTDGGATWARTLTGGSSSLKVHPTNYLRQYAGLDSTGIYRSVDAGDTWSLVTGPWSAGPGRLELAIAPSNPDVLYVVSSGGNAAKGLWRTSNAWSSTPTWVQVPNPPNPGGQWWFNLVVIVDPLNASILYFGETPLWKYDGTNWTDTSFHRGFGDNHALAWAGNRLVVGCDIGVWSTIDGGTTWTNQNAGGLSVVPFYYGSVHPVSFPAVLGGAQDHGAIKSGGSNWNLLLGADGSSSAYSAAHPDTDWALSGQYLDIRRTKDGGATLSAADGGITKSGAPFIARFEKCRANDDTFIAGTDRLWKSTNFFSAGTPSWSANSPSVGLGIAAIQAMGFAASDAGCNTYAFGASDGQLSMTANGGTIWADLDPGNMVPNRFVTDVAFNPTNANDLYVSLSGFDEGTPGQPGHLFRTLNALSPSPTWVNVSPPVNLPVNVIAVDPANSNAIYLGTDLGIWMSRDAGSTWLHYGPVDGLPNVPVFDIKISPIAGGVVAFTYGRGAFAAVRFTPSCPSDSLTPCRKSDDTPSRPSPTLKLQRGRAGGR